MMRVANLAPESKPLLRGVAEMLSGGYLARIRPTRLAKKRQVEVDNSLVGKGSVC